VDCPEPAVRERQVVAGKRKSTFPLE